MWNAYIFTGEEKRFCKIENFLTLKSFVNQKKRPKMESKVYFVVKLLIFIFYTNWIFVQILKTYDFIFLFTIDCRAKMQIVEKRIPLKIIFCGFWNDLRFESFRIDWNLIDGCGIDPTICIEFIPVHFIVSSIIGWIRF